MATVTQGSTDVGVQANVVSPAQIKPIDFTGVLEAANKIVESKTADVGAQLLGQSIDQYAKTIKDTRNRLGTQFSDEHIRQLNTSSVQDFYRKGIAAGMSVKDLKAGTEALKTAQESSDQFEIVHNSGIVTSHNRFTGETTVKAGSNYSEIISAEMESKLSPEIRLHRDQMTPDAKSADTVERVSRAVKMDSVLAKNAISQANIDSLKLNKQSIQLESEEAFMDLKQGLFSDFSRATNTILSRVSGFDDKGNPIDPKNKLLPSQAEAQIMSELEYTMLQDDAWRSAVYKLGQDPDALYNSWQQNFRTSAQTMIAAADPKNAMQYTALYEKATWEAKQSAILNNLDPQTAEVVAVASVASNLGDISLELRSLSPVKALQLSIAQQSSVRQMANIIGPLGDADATPTQWQAAIPYIDNVLLNATAEYNELDSKGKSLPVVRPSDIELMVRKVFSSPNYQKYVSPEQKQIHQQLLIEVRKNYRDKPFAEETIDSFIKQREADGTWEWLTTFGEAKERLTEPGATE